MKRRKFFANLFGLAIAPKILVIEPKTVAKAIEKTPEVIIPEEPLSLSGNLYIGLYEDYPNRKEASFEGYSRVPVKRDPKNWEIKGDPTMGRVLVENKERIIFPECKGGGLYIEGVVIYDKETGGNALFELPTNLRMRIEPGIKLAMEPGALIIEE